MPLRCKNYTNNIPKIRGKSLLGIELKAWRDKKGDPLEAGLEQLDSYLARLGEDFGWLVIFDRRSNALPLEERLSTQSTTTKNGRSVTVVRAKVGR